MSLIACRNPEYRVENSIQKSFITFGGRAHEKNMPLFNNSLSCSSVGYF